MIPAVLAILAFVVNLLPLMGLHKTLEEPSLSKAVLLAVKPPREIRVELAATDPTDDLESQRAHVEGLLKANIVVVRLLRVGSLLTVLAGAVLLSGLLLG